jgi:N-acetylglucosamine-6-phosphate deacetylase
MENVRIVTLAPELNNAPEVIEELTKAGITVSLGKNIFFKNYILFLLLSVFVS